MDARFDELRNFYQRLGDAMPASMGLPAALHAKAGNVCGDCFECCKFHLMLTRHEFDCIEAWLIEHHGTCHVRWVTCTTPMQDARLRQPLDPHARCPLYRDGGCMAYEVRPLACRMFGPMHPRSTRLPAPCVFTESKACESVEDIPLWDQYAEIIRRNRPSPPGYFVAVDAEVDAKN